MSSGAAKTLRGLVKTDVVEIDSFMKALSTEPLVLVTKNVSSKGAMTFDLSYFGVSLGQMACRVNQKDEVSWVEI